MDLIQRALFLYLLQSLSVIGSSLQNELVLLNPGCTCPGHTLMYECTVIGEGSGGATVWQGTAFDCESKNNEILLLHRRFGSDGGTSEECNEGAIVGQSVRVEGYHYTSRLNVTISPDMIGQRIDCAVDNGTMSIVIGSLSIQAIVPFSQVYITLVDFDSSQITFNWTRLNDPIAHSPDCPTLHYNILASNCGSCPTTTTNPTVTCIDVPTNGSMCTFAVQTVVCGDIVKTISDPVYVRNNSPEAIRKGDSRFIGTLAAASSLALLLLVCVVLFSMVIIFLIKSRAKHQSDSELVVNRLATNTVSESAKTDCPSSVDDADTNENYAYGVPLGVGAVKTNKNVAYAVTVTVSSS